MNTNDSTQTLVVEDMAKWRAQMEDLKAREAWHERSVGHVGRFATCWEPICKGERPVPR